MTPHRHTISLPPEATSVSVMFLQVLKSYAEGLGVDFAVIADAAGIDSVILNDGNARVPGRQFASMWHQVTAAGKDPNPGLGFGRELGRHYPMGSMLFTMMMNCATLGQALDVFIRYHHLMADAIQPRLTRRDDMVCLSWTLPHPGGEPQSYISEALLCIFQSILDRLSQGRLVPVAVNFTHAGTDDGRAYQAIFKSPVYFGARRDELLIDADALAMKIEFANQELFKLIESHAARADEAESRQGRWSRRVIYLIGDALARSTPPDIDAVSKQLGLSRRSLQQKLKEEGRGFRDCLAQVRKQTALDLLGRPDATICDVAFLLGYSEQSAFNHAFKRWTGMTPKAYRRESGDERRFRISETEPQLRYIQSARFSSMKRHFRFLLFSLGVASLVFACSSNSNLRPFASDGCSLFPDASLINQDDWCICCYEHDIAYWRGGTAEEREVADLALKACVIAKTGDGVLATLMYEGVRLGGSPYFYNWYRWGYGWPYERKYQALTPEEKAEADRLLKRYVSSDEPAVCRP